MTTIDSGAVILHPVKREWDELVTLEDSAEPDRHKPGPKPKRLVAIEVWGYEVGRGNRKKTVVPEDVYKLAAIGCTDREIATWWDIDENTLRYNFSEIMAKGRQDLKTALRQAMLKNALNGNAVMQIFLAKNMLGMSDLPQNSEELRPLPWTDDDSESATLKENK